jgi:FKBP-type peptidyl-prolyl cis-trans isomerase 2
MLASDPNYIRPLDGHQVHYTARFPDGTLFDSSYKRGRPLTMRIGAGKVRSKHPLSLTENDVQFSCQ